MSQEINFLPHRRRFVSCKKRVILSTCDCHRPHGNTHSFSSEDCVVDSDGISVLASQLTLVTEGWLMDLSFLVRNLNY